MMYASTRARHLTCTKVLLDVHLLGNLMIISEFVSEIPLAFPADYSVFHFNAIHALIAPQNHRVGIRRWIKLYYCHRVEVDSCRSFRTNITLVNSLPFRRHIKC